MGFDESLHGRYASAVKLMGELDRLRRVWMSHHPSPPLTRGGLFMLSMLDKLEQHGEEPVTPSRLAAATRQSAPVVSQRLRVLEEGGYVERTAARSDRRVTHLKLTEKGRSECRRALDVMLGSLERAMDSLEDGGAQEIVHLLGKLNHSLEGAFTTQNTNEGGNTPC